MFEEMFVKICVKVTLEVTQIQWRDHQTSCSVSLRRKIHKKREAFKDFHLKNGKEKIMVVRWNPEEG